MKPKSIGTFLKWDTDTSASITAPTFTLKGQPQLTRSNRFGVSQRTGYAARIATWEATICKIISMLTLSAGTGDGTALRCFTRFLCGYRLRSRRQRCDSGPKNRLEISLSERAFFHYVTLRNALGTGEGVGGNSSLTVLSKARSIFTEALSAGSTCSYFLRNQSTPLGIFRREKRSVRV